MRKLFIAILFSAFIGNLFADISVKSFRKLENDNDAKMGETSLNDQNGDVSAIIKVVTNETGFSFDCGQIGIVKTVYKPSEIWVYVPYGAKRISIMHQQLGQLRDWFFTLPIEKATVYRLELTTGRVVTKVEETEIETQWLIITTNPTGADVYIDGQPSGKTPNQSEFPIGKHTWKIQKELYQTEEGTLELLSGGDKQKIDLKLKPNFGTFQITTLPDNGASVNLDGIPTGKKTPCNLETVPAGEHIITVNLDMFEAATQRVKLLAGETKPVNFEMNSTFGEVNITTEPRADIYVNGKLKGNGSWQGKLSPSVYTFEAKLDKYTPAYEKQNVQIGQPLNLILKPIARTGSMKIMSTPFEATITIDGKVRGQSPITLKNMLIGDYSVELSLPGYSTAIEKTTVVEGQTAFVNATLTSAGEANEPKVNIDSNSSGERKVTINSNPSGATLTIDGERIGQTPLSKNLKIGSHELSIEQNGKTTGKIISIEQTGGETEFTLTLPQDKAVETIAAVPEKTETKQQNFNQRSVTIYSVPSVGSLYIDDNFVGLTPFTGNMTVGMHNIRVEQNGQKTDQWVAIGESGGETNFTLKLPQVNISENVNQRRQPISGNESLYQKKELVKSPKRKNPTMFFMGGGIASPLVKKANGDASGLGMGYEFTLALVKTVGVYAKLTSNFSSVVPEYKFSTIPSSQYYYTSSTSTASYSRFGIVGGLMLNIKPIIFYAGGGIGKYDHFIKTRLYNYADDSYVKESIIADNNSFSGIEADGGIMINLKPFALTIGVTSLEFKYLELKAGIGLLF